MTSSSSSSSSALLNSAIARYPGLELSAGQRLRVEIDGEMVTLELVRPLNPHHHAWLLRRCDTEELWWLWRSPEKRQADRWRRALLEALAPMEVTPPPHVAHSLCTQWLPLPKSQIETDHRIFLVLSPAMQHKNRLCACDELLWAKIPTDVALRAVEELAITLEWLRFRGLGLGGLKRSHLHWDEERERLLITCMPQARTWRNEDEECWRDIRLLGDLLFEKILERPCPNGHELAALLQNSTRMREVGLTQPGLIQLLAGCVTPYGDIAYLEHSQFLEGIRYLQDELYEPLSVSVGSASTMGGSIFRKNNQDSFGTLELSHQRASRTHRALFACVADGIGGISDGERASALATNAAMEAFMRAWSSYSPETIARYPSDMARAITKVTSQRVAMEGEFMPHQNRGGTTFSAVLLTRGRLGVAHVGDSRIYLIRGGAITQLTTDHTLATLLDELGDLGKDDPKPQDVRNRTISRFLTTSMELPLERIDTISEEALTALCVPSLPDAIHEGIALEEGDTIILSSDGLHENLTPRDILEMATQHAHLFSPQQLAEHLTRRAMETLSRDNVTVLVLRVQQTG